MFSVLKVTNFDRKGVLTKTINNYGRNTCLTGLSHAKRAKSKVLIRNFKHIDQPDFQQKKSWN